MHCLVVAALGCAACAHVSPGNTPVRCHMQLYAVLCANHRCDSRRIEKETPRFAAHSIQSQTTVPERSGSADPAQPKLLTVGVFSARSSNRKRFWSDSCDERPGGRLCSGARRPALGRDESLPATRSRLYASNGLNARNSNRHVFPSMWVMTDPSPQRPKGPKGLRFSSKLLALGSRRR